MIELLVVIVIIAILAAIAIPVFFSQRDKGLTAQVSSALKNGATIMQAWYTENGADYAPPHGVAPGAVIDMAWLEAEGWKPIEGVYIDVIAADGSAFCLSGVHDGLAGLQMQYRSGAGVPEDGDCS